ncbi:MAG TPA: septum formation protein Maf [Firmicutes bacterium]|nr:septum formation protein Maf [Bacillota bacterium]
MDKPIYLGSKSPRRRELLALTGLIFKVRPLEEMDEEALLSDYRGEIIGGAEFLAVEKARKAMKLEMPGYFITADTLVISDDGKVLGKPRDNDEAKMFLDRLAGNWHTVATGVALSEAPCEICPDGRIESIVETTRVKFAPMDALEIQQYIETGEPFDKAGGYGIQGRASIHIERIEGCYFNVVGFPLHAFWKMWKRFKD